MVFANDWHIILRLTCHGTGVATGAGIEIHRHSPLLLGGQFGVGVKGNIFWDVTIHTHRLGEGVVFIVALDGSLANEIAAFHAAVLLGLSQRVVAIRDFKGDTAQEEHGVRRTKRVGIESHIFHESRNAIASVTESYRERVVGMARGDDCSGFDGFFPVRDFHDVSDEVIVDIVAHLLSNIAEDIEIVGFDAEFFCGSWTNHHRVVPSDFGYKVGCFNEPRVIGIAPVIHARALKENKLQDVRLCCLSLLGKGGGGSGVERDFGGSECRTWLEAIAEEGVPSFVSGTFG